METYQLKEYLGKIMKLETKKYELDNIINRLKEKVEIEKWIINQKCYPIDSVYPINMVKILEQWFMLLVLILFACIIVITMIMEKSILIAFMISLILSLCVGFYPLFRDENRKKNESLERIRQTETKNIEIRKKAETAERRSDIYQKELLVLTNNYKAIEDTLSKLYDTNIIYFKYRGLVPVSMFYEYLESGRCLQLEGPDGAYNLYENELLHHIIIGKLDEIKQVLEDIRNIQYTTYQMIKEGNKNILNLSTAVTHAAIQLQDISNSTDIIQYNTSLVAANTETIKWIETCNYLNV